MDKFLERLAVLTDSSTSRVVKGALEESRSIARGSPRRNSAAFRCQPVLCSVPQTGSGGYPNCLKTRELLICETWSGIGGS